MHSCPECGQSCDCDGEDHWNDAAAAECEHDCEEDDDGHAYYDSDAVIVYGPPESEPY